MHSLEKLAKGDNVTVALFATRPRDVRLGLALASGNYYHLPGPVVAGVASIRDHGLDRCDAVAVFDDIVVRLTKIGTAVLGCGMRFNRDRDEYPYEHSGPGPRDQRMICAKRVGPPPVRVTVQPGNDAAPVLGDLLESMGEFDAAASVRSRM